MVPSQLILLDFSACVCVCKPYCFTVNVVGWLCFVFVCLGVFWGVWFLWGFFLLLVLFGVRGGGEGLFVGALLLSVVPLILTHTVSQVSGQVLTPHPHCRWTPVVFTLLFTVFS